MTKPTSKLQLAKTYNSTEHTYVWNRLQWVEPKIDGCRALIFYDTLSESWTASTRSGEVIYNVGHILDSLQESGFPTDVLLDGEIWADTFENTVHFTRTMRDLPGAAEEVRFYVFDCITRQEWDQGPFRESLESRKQRLSDQIRIWNPIGIFVVPHWEAHSEEEMQGVYEASLANGFEGVIIKSPHASYSVGRSDIWLKVKPVLSDEFPVTGFSEGENGFAGTLGAVWFDASKQGLKAPIRHAESGKRSGMVAGSIQCKVGTGFKKRERDIIWASREQILHDLKLWVEVEYQSITNDGKLRFPKFKAFRTGPGGNYVNI